MPVCHFAKHTRWANATKLIVGIIMLFMVVNSHLLECGKASPLWYFRFGGGTKKNTKAAIPCRTPKGHS
jgi:hypothetical protein